MGPDLFKLPLAFHVLYWGVIVSTVLFGITVLQGWTYLQTNRDQWPIRFIVYVILLCNLAGEGFIMAFGYFYFVQNFANFEGLQAMPRYTAAEPFLAFPTNFMIQLFFASRVRILKRSWIAPGLIIPTAVAAFVVAMMISVEVYRQDTLAVFLSSYMKTIIPLHIGLAALSDVTANILLTSWTISGMKSIRFCLGRTQSILKTILVYVVTRGFFLTSMQLATIFVYLRNTDNLFWTPFHFCMSRVYVITMLSMLNSRSPERQETPFPATSSPPSTDGKDTVFSTVIDIRASGIRPRSYSSGV